MRLKNIKLAGFKSFVDPTTVPLPTNLTAIVGPNGCGKSNIIDAVRWVMGESSAKQLRGESLDDVIFNGSTARKPVGQASIELTFDNADSSLIGQYGAYSEIAIRREITRDGQSNYYLNGTRCRRRDIVDIFLGTGLGPRSYAIIEQGMISRLIEAKPEELRHHIEEAAGISKYKERRRETELRIQHTQENLARLNDIREELTKQLNHLKRQANAAERYKLLKEEERLLRAQIQALRWRSLNEQHTQQQVSIEAYEVQLAQAIARQQANEQALEENRVLQQATAIRYNEAQANYYSLNNETTSLKQSITHQKERRIEWQKEYDEITRQEAIAKEHLSSAGMRREQLDVEVADKEPQWQQAKEMAAQTKEQLQTAEQAVHAWQEQWEAFNRKTAEVSQRAEVERTRIQHLEQRLHSTQQRITRLESEYCQQELALSTEPLDDLLARIEHLQEKLAETEDAIQLALHNMNSQREQNQQITRDLDNAKQQVQRLRGQQASLEALQQAALGQQEKIVMDWLKEHDLVELPRLAQIIEVETGWEKAVETILSGYLQAICVEDMACLLPALQNLPRANVSIVHKSVTANKVHAQAASALLNKTKIPAALAPLLTPIHAVETLAEAHELLKALSSQESVVTRQGVWLGHGWLYAHHKNDAKTGILQRERELIALKQTIEEAQLTVENYQIALEVGHEKLAAFEEQREVYQRQKSELHAQKVQVQAEQKVKEAQLKQLQQRNQQIHDELKESKQQLEKDKAALSEARHIWQEAMSQLEIQAAEREQWAQAKLTHQQYLEEARRQFQREQEAEHQLALHMQAAKLQLTNTAQEQVRLQAQLETLQSRHVFLQNALNESEEPLLDLEEKLAEMALICAEAEVQLADVKNESECLTKIVQALEKAHHEFEQGVLVIRQSLEEARLLGQGTEVRAKGLQEQIQESGHDLQTVLTELPQDMTEASAEEMLQQTLRRIERLGPINLAAIDEFTTHAERKNYLDAQHADLMDALNTLQEAMQKMDQETKLRFKETYDQINAQFQTLFPVLFGGGRASLDLNSGDWLTAGISLFAQPPGKRNSTIHLLSGGEKALTAIALVFAFFQLNPAPFCMLDEVDAPLDDANVSRFCNLVKQMSEKVQFIFISHNKLAIEMAKQLAGVTMQEAGVSRLVAVDMEAAIAMAVA
jgi:chromosome segregation protein